MILFSFLASLMTWEAHLKFIGKVIFGEIVDLPKEYKNWICVLVSMKKGMHSKRKKKLQNRLCIQCEYKDVYGRQNFDDWWVTGNGITHTHSTKFLL